MAEILVLVDHVDGEVKKVTLELLTLAKSLRNPHAEATTGVDLQVPTILDFLQRHGLELRGGEVVDIGSWQGKASHPLSIRLSPLRSLESARFIRKSI